MYLSYISYILAGNFVAKLIKHGCQSAQFPQAVGAYRPENIAVCNIATSNSVLFFFALFYLLLVVWKPLPSC